MTIVCCPTCGHVLPSFVERVAARAAELRAECDERGFNRDDDLIIEQDAAVLLRFENHRSLANRRYTDQPIAFEKIGRHAYYRIVDLAAFQVHRKPL